MPLESNRPSFPAWLLWVGFGLSLAWLSGRLQTRLVPDSASYLEYSFGSLEAICRSIRMPLYPAWLLLIDRSLGIDWVPAAQVILHATAVWLLVWELGAWGMAKVERSLAGGAVAIGCTPMDHINTISTDAVAASLGVLMVVAVMNWGRRQGAFPAALIVAIAAAITIFVRPVYLYAIPWLVIGGTLVLYLQVKSWPAALIGSLVAPAISSAIVLGWMLLRLFVVGEFAVLPFGHQNLAGVLVQLVSDEELGAIQGDAATMAQAIVKQKADYLASGNSFAAGPDRATMTIDARWDAMTYFVVVAAAREQAGSDPVAQHRAIGTLNQALLRCYPLRYLLWIGKAIRRGAWAIAADIVMHPIFLAAIVCMIAFCLYRAVHVSDLQPSGPPTEALAVLTIVTWTYLGCGLAFIALTSPPIGRFSDAAAIFLPAWALVHWYKVAIGDFVFTSIGRWRS